MSSEAILNQTTNPSCQLLRCMREGTRYKKWRPKQRIMHLIVSNQRTTDAPLLLYVVCWGSLQAEYNLELTLIHGKSMDGQKDDDGNAWIKNMITFVKVSDLIVTNQLRHWASPYLVGLHFMETYLTTGLFRYDECMFDGSTFSVTFIFASCALVRTRIGTSNYTYSGIFTTSLRHGFTILPGYKASFNTTVFLMTR